MEKRSGNAEDAPSVLKSWRIIYYIVILFLVFQILLYHFITRLLQ